MTLLLRRPASRLGRFGAGRGSAPAPSETHALIQALIDGDLDAGGLDFYTGVKPLSTLNSPCVISNGVRGCKIDPFDYGPGFIYTYDGVADFILNGPAIPVNKWAAWTFVIDTAGVLTSIPGDDNATGYASASAAYANLPPVPVGQFLVGFVFFYTWLAFTPGTTSAPPYEPGWDGDRLLCGLTFDTPAAPEANLVDGNTISLDEIGGYVTFDGTPTWCRSRSADDVTRYDATVGAVGSGADIEIDDTTWAQGQLLTPTGLTVAVVDP